VAEAHADVAIVGLGVIGLSTALALARRGLRVVGIDRFGSGHPATSSTGPSRSIRLAYEQPIYVELAREALERWRGLERDTGDRILLLTGQLDLGPAAKLEGLAACMRAADAPFDELDADGIIARFPEIRPHRGEHALFHAEAGTVLADVGMRALRHRAEDAGAALSEPEAAVALDGSGDVATIETDRGRTMRASTAIVSAGPWLGGLLTPIGLELPLAPRSRRSRSLACPSSTSTASGCTDTRCPRSATRSRSTPARPIHGIPMPTRGRRISSRPSRSLGGSRRACSTRRRI
jgi:sarcosine oxidase